MTLDELIVECQKLQSDGKGKNDVVIQHELNVTPVKRITHSITFNDLVITYAHNRTPHCSCKFDEFKM